MFKQIEFTITQTVNTKTVLNMPDDYTQEDLLKYIRTIVILPSNFCETEYAMGNIQEYWTEEKLEAKEVIK